MLAFSCSTLRRMFSCRFRSSSALIAPDAEARGVARGVTPKPPRAPANERAEPGVGGCIEPGVGGWIAAGRMPSPAEINPAAPDRR